MRIIEVQPPQVCGISGIPEVSSGMETVFAMETIVFALTGRSTSWRNTRGIGIAIGTDIATIGGTATAVASSTDRG
jgi:hypothetical protein